MLHAHHHEPINCHIEFNPALIQILNQNLTSASPAKISVGHIPEASESQTGIPFSDGFPCVLPPSPPSLPPANSSNEKPVHQLRNQLSNPDRRSSTVPTRLVKKQPSIEFIGDSKPTSNPNPRPPSNQNPRPPSTQNPRPPSAHKRSAPSIRNPRPPSVPNPRPQSIQTRSAPSTQKRSAPSRQNPRPLSIQKRSAPSIQKRSVLSIQKRSAPSIRTLRPPLIQVPRPTPIQRRSAPPLQNPRPLSIQKRSASSVQNPKRQSNPSSHRDDGKKKIVNADVKPRPHELVTTAPKKTASTDIKPDDSESSSKGKKWLMTLKSHYSEYATEHYNKQIGENPSIVPNPPPQADYPQVGDSFPSVDEFKSACLWAGWSHGHDMHVRNFYRTESFEKCVFTCRYDRAPPRGYNCSFRITALYDKLNAKSLGLAEEWKVTNSHLAHSNHSTVPGFFDPLGSSSKPSAKRTAEVSFGTLDKSGLTSAARPTKKVKNSLGGTVKLALLNQDLGPSLCGEDDTKEDGRTRSSLSLTPLTPSQSSSPLLQLVPQDQPNSSNKRPRRSAASSKPGPASR